MPIVVRIPEVYDAFTKTRSNSVSVTYIVMEKVKGDTFAEYRKLGPWAAGQAMVRIANAVRDIWDIPLPPNATIESLEQQRPVERLFSDCGLDRCFDDTIELEDWVNAKLERGGYPDRVALQGERLYICHCDLTQFNITMGEPIAIVDWGFAGLSKGMRAMSLAARFHFMP